MTTSILTKPSKSASTRSKRSVSFGSATVSQAPSQPSIPNPTIPMLSAKSSTKSSKKLKSNKTSEEYANEQHEQLSSNPADTNMLMLPGSKKKKEKTKNESHKKTISKNESRKLRQLMKKKKMLAERQEFLTVLKEKQLSQDELALLDPVDHRKVSRKQIMQRVEMKMARGLHVDEEEAGVKKVIGKIREKYATKVEEVKWEEVFQEKPAEDEEEFDEMDVEKDSAVVVESNDAESMHDENGTTPQRQIQTTTATTTTTTTTSQKPASSFLKLDFFGNGAASLSSAKPAATLPKKASTPADDDSSEDESSGDDDSMLDTHHPPPRTHKPSQKTHTDDSSEDDTSGEDEDDSMEDEELHLIMQQRLNRKRKRRDDTNDETTQPLKKRSRQWEEDVTRQFSTVIETIESSIQDASVKESLLKMIEATRQTVLQADAAETKSTPISTKSSTKSHSKAPPKITRVIDTIQRKTSAAVENLNDILDAGSGEPVPLQTKKFVVRVNRDPKIQEARLNLPVVGEEQEIMEKILENDVVIICGETGSGKTTQVPQFLYEYGFGHEQSGYPGLIGVTQPRRVAAISTAKRVAEELNTPFGSTVSYHVRYDNNLSDETTIKFMTDGVLLKEIQSDILLSHYSCLLLDEAHERNVNTDILIGMLSRMIPERNRRARNGDVMPNGKPITPLKLVIMSATLRVDDFTKNALLFPPGRVPTVINVQSRQYPVHVHFSRHTEYFDYIGAAVKKTKKIHKTLPPGGILIFLTGKQEIDYCVKQLREYSAQLEKKLENQITEDEPQSATAEDEDAKIIEMGNLSSDDEEDMGIDSDDEEFDRTKPLFEVENRTVEADASSTTPADPNEEGQTTTLFADNITDPKLKEQGKANIQKLNKAKKCTKLYVLPLYSMLHPKDQLKVFQPPPSEEYRLCVVATNVAETSLTIPGIRYVIDPGRVKEREFDDTGVSRMVVQWTSQAGANQRAGRAGRTGPGHAYRLYSSAVYQHKFKPFFDPEIVKIPIDNIVLQMKSMDINNIENFPLPTPPAPDALKKAIRNLIHLQALKLRSNSQLSDATLDTKITGLGRKMANYPLDPRFSKMLIMAKKTDVLPHIIGIVSALTVEFLFMHSFKLQDLSDKYQPRDGQKVHQKKIKMTSEDAEKKKQFLKSKKQFSDAFSDHLALLKAMGAYQHGGADDEFCMEHHIHAKNMREAYKLARQLTAIVQKQEEGVKLKLHPKTKVVKLAPPTQVQEVQIRQILCAAYVDQVARKVVTNEELSNLTELDKMGKLTEKNRPYITLSLGPNVPVYIHPSSYLSGVNPKYIVYSEIVQNEKGRYYMKGVCAVDDSWLCAYGGSLVQYSKPLQEPSPVYNQKKDRLDCFVLPSYGENAEWKLSFRKQEYPHESDKEQQQYFNWFASLFIQGKLFTSLPSKHDMLHSSKELRQGNIVSKKAIAIVDALRELCKQKGTSLPTKAMLQEVWKKDKTFLLREYLSFVQQNFREQVATQMWPPKE